jgi:hypothetical protein
MKISSIEIRISSNEGSFYHIDANFIKSYEKDFRSEEIGTLGAAFAAALARAIEVAEERLAVQDAKGEQR